MCWKEGALGFGQQSLKIPDAPPAIAAIVHGQPHRPLDLRVLFDGLFDDKCSTDGLTLRVIASVKYSGPPMENPNRPSKPFWRTEQSGALGFNPI